MGLYRVCTDGGAGVGKMRPGGEGGGAKKRLGTRPWPNSGLPTWLTSPRRLGQTEAEEDFKPHTPRARLPRPRRPEPRFSIFGIAGSSLGGQVALAAVAAQS